ncbi:MAG: hypothetical protein HUU21_18365 [Polyangiaceae bacterium]|nr:hypothetical protein [Polyangiaceae bacterium]
MARANKSVAELLQRKENKLRRDFNFLENLLAFCVHPSRNVPEESGVHFQISSAIKDKGVCLIFKIDRGSDPLIPDTEHKPDYMTFFASRDRCICTIIELKGTDSKKLKHGIEQIRALRDKLRNEIAAHLPRKCRGSITFQGLLLTPPNSDIPRHQIEREKNNGLTILALQWPHQFQLFDYVQKANAIDERYVHKKDTERNLRGWNAIEEILVQCALPERIDDAFRAKRKASAHKGNTGVYLNFADNPEKPRAYAALSACCDSAVFAFSSADFKQKIERELARLGLVDLVELCVMESIEPA